jgi:hypothetical protein
MRAGVPGNHRLQEKTMSGLTKVALSAVLLIGMAAPALAESRHAKRTTTQKVQRHTPQTAPQAQNPGRGCVVDDGGGRVRPCNEAGGGGGGGGGGY